MVKSYTVFMDQNHCRISKCLITSSLRGAEADLQPLLISGVEIFTSRPISSYQCDVTEQRAGRQGTRQLHPVRASLLCPPGSLKGFSWFLLRNFTTAPSLPTKEKQKQKTPLLSIQIFPVWTLTVFYTCMCVYSYLNLRTAAYRKILLH